MANRQMDVRLIMRNGTAAQWTATNVVLLKGEMGLEIDTGKLKFGDGITAWNALSYYASFEVHKASVAPTVNDADYDLGMEWIDTVTGNVYFLVDNTPSAAVWQRMVSPEDLSELGYGDMLKSVFADNAKVAQGYVSRAIVTDALTTARSISGAGDDIEATATNFDGSANIVIPMILKDTGVTAGTYVKVTVDAKGRVTGASTLLASDIPDLTLAKITDAGTAAAADLGLAAGNVPVLDADGKINSSVLPSLAIMDIYPDIADEEEMLELEAQKGDIALRVDTHTTWILVQEPASTLANWRELETPASPVNSVNGKIGTVVLTSDDIAEGTTNVYWTEERFTEALEAEIGDISVADLSDGADVLMATDNFVFNGGTATA